MKHINNYITEKLKISKNQKIKYTLFPETLEELKEMIEKEIEKNGTKCSLNHIDTSKIKDMNMLFYNNKTFDGDISEWDVSNVTDMSFMFMYSDYTGKNGDISDWDVSSVKSMVAMFRNSEFNEDISRWDISSVQDMSYMFSLSKFNQDISKWDVSKVTNMNDMFSNSAFNQDISKWKINPKCRVNDMFTKCNILPAFKPGAML